MIITRRHTAGYALLWAPCVSSQGGGNIQELDGSRQGGGRGDSLGGIDLDKDKQVGHVIIGDGQRPSKLGRVRLECAVGQGEGACGMHADRGIGQTQRGDDQDNNVLKMIYGAKRDPDPCRPYLLLWPPNNVIWFRGLFHTQAHTMHDNTNRTVAPEVGQVL